MEAHDDGSDVLHIKRNAKYSINSSRLKTTTAAPLLREGGDVSGAKKRAPCRPSPVFPRQQPRKAPFSVAAKAVFLLLLRPLPAPVFVATLGSPELVTTLSNHVIVTAETPPPDISLTPIFSLLRLLLLRLAQLPVGCPGSSAGSPRCSIRCSVATPQRSVADIGPTRRKGFSCCIKEFISSG